MHHKFSSYNHLVQMLDYRTDLLLRESVATSCIILLVAGQLLNTSGMCSWR